MKMTVDALQAKHGDAIVVKIEWGPGQVFRMLIDGGPPGRVAKSGNPALKKHQAALTDVLDELLAAGHSLDLTVLTHIDSDHIGGLLAAYTREDYRGVLGPNAWFNSLRLISNELETALPENSENIINLVAGGETSVKQGIAFDDLLNRHQPDRRLVIAGQRFTFEWGTIDILSPTTDQLRSLAKTWEKKALERTTSSAETDYAKRLEELQREDEFAADTSVTNASSIAVLIRSGSGAMLLLGDSLSQTICDSLRALGFDETNRLPVNVCKLSHHGSKGNTCSELLSIIDVDYFVISTNGTNLLPDKQTIGRLLKYCPESKIFFNYPELIEKIFKPYPEELGMLQHILAKQIEPISIK